MSVETFSSVDAFSDFLPFDGLGMSLSFLNMGSPFCVIFNILNNDKI